MDISLSTQLSQTALASEVGTAVARKGLDQQKIEGQNLAQLMASAAPAFADPALGQKIDLRA
jgi:Putative motility protein